MDHLLRGEFYHPDLLTSELRSKGDALRKRMNLYL